MWENIACRLEGSLVVLEPLEQSHEQDLFEAARDPRIWRYMPFDAGGSGDLLENRTAFRTWLDAALAASEKGDEAAFATLDAESSEPIGSTRYLALRPALSSVALPHYEMGRWAVRHLIEQSEQGKAAPTQHAIGCPYVERESV